MNLKLNYQSTPLEINILSLCKFVNDNNTSEVRPILNKILGIIVANGTFWKTFKQWGKKNGITKEELNRSRIDKIANAFESNCLNVDKIKALKDSISKTEEISKCFNFQKDHIPLFTPEAMRRPLHEFHPDFLREGLCKGYKSVQRALSVIKAYCELEKTQNDHNVIEQWQNNIKVWLLQYLARGSKIPLLEQKGPIHISPLEYSNSNQAEYYRHDGGAIISLLIKFIKEKYSFPPNNQYVLETIKPNCFSSISQVICQIFKIDYFCKEEDDMVIEDKATSPFASAMRSAASEGV